MVYKFIVYYMLKLPHLFDKYAYLIFMDDILDIYTGSFQNAVRSFLAYFGSASSAPVACLATFVHRGAINGDISLDGGKHQTLCAAYQNVQW